MTSEQIEHYRKYSKADLEKMLKFFTTPKDDLYPHPRGFDCGPCLTERCGRIPCMTGETPVGMVNWQVKMCVPVIRDLREALQLGTAEEHTEEDLESTQP